MKYIKQFFIILAFSLAGELTHYLVPLPVPASIYGLVYLVIALKSGRLACQSIEGAGDFLVEIMPLMFVPAGVGLMASWGALRSVLVPVCVITAVSTVLVFAVTGKLAQWLLTRSEVKSHE